MLDKIMNKFMQPTRLTWKELLWIPVWIILLPFLAIYFEVIKIIKR